jgi:hypothetical protein
MAAGRIFSSPAGCKLAPNALLQTRKSEFTTALDQIRKTASAGAISAANE